MNMNSPEYCQDDWVEIYNMYRDNTEKMLGRYCGTTAPGPIESTLGALGIKVILHTDSNLVYSGFKARYVFENAKSIFGGSYNSISCNLQLVRYRNLYITIFVAHRLWLQHKQFTLRHHH